jgi:hypothetical protein
MRQSVDPLAAGGSGAMGARQSLDPMAASWADEQWAPGRLLTVKSSAQWEALLREHADKLVVLMCKSHSCRPCKMFTRKYLSVVSAGCAVRGAACAAAASRCVCVWGALAGARDRAL